MTSIGEIGAQEHLGTYLGAIGVSANPPETIGARAERPSAHRQELAPAPVYKPGVYAITPYRVPVRTQERGVKVVDINWSHTPENAPATAEAIRAHGCGTVAVEITDLHTPQQVTEMDAKLNRMVNPNVSPQEDAAFTKQYGQSYVPTLVAGLRGSGVRLKVIDSPVEANVYNEFLQMINACSKVDAAIKNIDVIAARDSLDTAIRWGAPMTVARDDNMARQITELIEQATREGDTRPIAVLKGSLHHQVMQKVPGARGTHDMTAINSLIPYNMGNAMQAFRESPNNPPAKYQTEIDKGVAAGLLSTLYTISIGDAQKFVQALDHSQINQMLSNVDRIMRSPRTQGAPPRYRAMGHLDEWLYKNYPQ